MRRRKIPEFLLRQAALFSRRRFLQQFCALPAIAGLRRFPFLGALAAPSQFALKDPGCHQWHHVGAHGGQVRRKVSSGNRRCGLCVLRLRQRRLDGHLYGQQRPIRFLYAASPRCGMRFITTIATALSRMSPQPAGARMWRLRLRSCGRRLRRRRFPDLYVTQFGRSVLFPQQWQWNLHGRHRKSRGSGAGMDLQRRMV